MTTITFEEEIEKLNLEYEKFKIGELRLNVGYPLLEIWIEDLNEEENFIHSFLYKKDLKHESDGDIIAEEKISNIKFKDANLIDGDFTYDKFKKLVFDTISNFYSVSTLDEREKIINITKNNNF